MTTDVLRPLLQLEGVAEAMDQARAAVDTALAHRVLRRHGGQVAAEAALRSARASAALEGHAYSLEEVRAGTVTDPVVQGSLRVSEKVGLADLWGRAPRQALARLHALAARGSVTDADLGRPTTSDPQVMARIDALVELVTRARDVPAVLLAAVVHGELLTLRLFPGPNGVVARAAARLTLIERGLDPRALMVTEVGHLARHPEYVGAANAYATGTPDGVRSWLRHYATAVVLGAQETAAIASALQ